MILENIYSPKVSTEETLDLICMYMDEHFYDLQDTDNILESLDVSRLDLPYILAFLTMTNIQKDNLKQREMFFFKCKEEIIKRDQYTEDLFRGLE